MKTMIKVLVISQVLQAMAIGGMYTVVFIDEGNVKQLLSQPVVIAKK